MATPAFAKLGKDRILIYRGCIFFAIICNLFIKFIAKCGNNIVMSLIVIFGKIELLVTPAFPKLAKMEYHHYWQYLVSLHFLPLFAISLLNSLPNVERNSFVMHSLPFLAK